MTRDDADPAFNDDQSPFNADQVLYWNEVAGAKWVANQDRLDRLMAPLGDALVAAAAVREGEGVIEIGPGCGDLSLRLAGEAGAAGHILAVDVSAPMLAHAEARRLASPTGLAPIEWRLADAMVAGFEPVHDLLVSRFGVMFFEDRPRAFANLRSALRPGGRFAFIAWRARAENEWMQAPLDWIAPALPSDPEVPGEVGPFALADRGETVGWLEGAGFSDVTVTPVDRRLTIGLGATDAAAAEDALVILADTGPAARRMRDADALEKGRAIELLREGIARHARAGRVELGAACWIYAGRA